MQVQAGLTPRYYQLKEILARRIQAGEFQPGDQFPTDDELCQAYSLSRGTVRRAVDMLVEDGRLRREQGRGTFVTAPPRSPVVFRLAGFDEEMRQRGLKTQHEAAAPARIPGQRRDCNPFANPRR